MSVLERFHCNYNPYPFIVYIECAATGDCIYNFKQDNVTSSFKWYRNFILDENFPIRNPGSDPDKKVLIATVKNRNLKRNEHSILSTNIPIKKKHQCIDFYYYMYSDDGCDVIRFSVILKCAGHPDEVIIKTSGTRKKKWNYVLYDVKKPIGTKCQVSTAFKLKRIFRGHFNIANF